MAAAGEVNSCDRKEDPEQRVSHLPSPRPLDRGWDATSVAHTQGGSSYINYGNQNSSSGMAPSSGDSICAKPTFTITQFLQRTLAMALIAVDIQSVSKGLGWGKRKVEACRTG